jgi:hypothetical protein
MNRKKCTYTLSRRERVEVRGSNQEAVVLDPYPRIRPFSAIVPCFALPPACLQASRLEKGRLVIQLLAFSHIRCISKVRNYAFRKPEQVVTPAKAGVQLVDFPGFRPSPE